MTETAVDIRTKYDANRPSTFLELWAEEAVPGQRLDFTTVPLPGSAGTTWVINNGTDTPDEVKSIDGAIVATSLYSALHFKSYDEKTAEDSGRPDAWSTDGVHQVVPPETFEMIEKLNETRREQGLQELPFPAPLLADCPYAKWPNEGGAGVLLGTMNRPQTRSYLELYVLTALRPLPLKVRVPAMSQVKYQEYSTGILNEGIRPSGIETKISLRKVASKGGKDYGEPVFSRGEVFDREHAAEMKSFSDEMKGIVANGGLASLTQLAAPAPVQQIAAPANAPRMPGQDAYAAPVEAPAAPVELTPVAETEPAPVEPPAEAPVPAGVGATASDDLDDI